MTDKAFVRGEVELVELAKLKPNGWNPNKVPGHIMSSIKHGLVADGWIASHALLVWGTDERGRHKGLIIDGEHRWLCARDVGMLEGPAVVLDGISEREAMALTVKLNQKRGDWDQGELTELLSALDLGDVDTSALDLGFSTDELSSMLMIGEDAVDPDLGVASNDHRSDVEHVPRQELIAPFPWFGGKSRVSHLVWERFGDVKNYVEPFFGSGAVLLGRPIPFKGVEAINDLDSFVCNFWRAIKHDPEKVAELADHPAVESDLHARHHWLTQQRDGLRDRLEADPGEFDAKIAGWWLWGLKIWIGKAWCANGGSWRVIDGKLVKGEPHEKGIWKQRPKVSYARDLPTSEYMGALSERLRMVTVLSGDWSRVCTPTVTYKLGLTGVLLDPPYANTAARCEKLYAIDSLSVAHDVREWAIKQGDNSDMRIALCGYEGEHSMPEDWEKVTWCALKGNAGKDNDNRRRERIWFSPSCLRIADAL